MRKFFQFWGLCFQKALRGNSAFANNWQWLIGVPACSAIAIVVARWLGLSGLSVGNQIADPALAAGGAFVVTWFAAFSVRFLNAPAELYWDQRKKVEAHSPRVELLFPEQCNSPAVDSAFRRSWSPLSSGKPARRLSFHRLYVGARNPTNDRTLRNVRLVMESLRLGPGQILNTSCLCDRTGTPAVDIPPGGVEYFQIGEGFDESDAGIFRSKLMGTLEYEALMLSVDGQTHSRFKLLSQSASVPLLLNDGYQLDLIAYADDIPPTRNVLTIDAKSIIRCHLANPDGLPL